MRRALSSEQAARLKPGVDRSALEELFSVLEQQLGATAAEFTGPLLVAFSEVAAYDDAHASHTERDRSHDPGTNPPINMAPDGSSARPDSVHKMRLERVVRAVDLPMLRDFQFTDPHLQVLFERAQGSAFGKGSPKMEDGF